MIDNIPPERWPDIEIVGEKWTRAHKRPLFEETDEGAVLFVSSREAATWHERTQGWVNYNLRINRRFKPIDPDLAREIFNHNDKNGFL